MRGEFGVEKEVWSNKYEVDSIKDEIIYWSVHFVKAKQQHSGIFGREHWITEIKMNRTVPELGKFKHWAG